MSEGTAQVWIVFNAETDAYPELLGTYVETVEDTVAYVDTSGLLRHAPEDCVYVKKVVFDQRGGAR